MQTLEQALAAFQIAPRQASGRSHRNRVDQAAADRMVKAGLPRSARSASAIASPLRPGEGADEGPRVQTRVDNIPDELLQPVGRVVAIRQRDVSRQFAGFLRPQNHMAMLFTPRDTRVPRMNVPMEEIPEEIRMNPAAHQSSLVTCRLVVWEADSQLALGSFASSLGAAGAIESETRSILLEHDIPTQEFSQEVLDCLPKAKEAEMWSIPAEEVRQHKHGHQE
jgi:exoribonuclease R